MTIKEMAFHLSYELDLSPLHIMTKASDDEIIQLYNKYFGEA